MFFHINIITNLFIYANNITTFFLNTTCLKLTKSVLSRKPHKLVLMYEEMKTYRHYLKMLRTQIVTQQHLYF